MRMDLFAMWALDGLASVFNSPFIIPVAGCVMILGMSVGSMWAKVRSEEIQSHERLALIAQGLPVEPNWDEVTRKAAGQVVSLPVGPGGKVNDGAGARRAGTVLVSIGLGLFAFFAALTVIVRVREVLAGAAAGILPLAIGIGFLVDARLKKAEFERRLGAGGYPGPHPGAGQLQEAATLAAAPPPPPVSMTAAQASDWRPLH